ncbi:MAG: flagellar basal body L-ring protein FlgH, partial [Verrucomicrobiota bacterium]|nr:flagellar basal body L-ring protein FlgH [Verrucomicrobiota bacterium]
NGVLVLEGARMVTFSGESYYAVLKGMVRQEDIGFGFKDGLRYRNIVSSQFIADAQIEFVSKGSLNDAQKESWYQKLAAILNPF